MVKTQKKVSFKRITKLLRQADENIGLYWFKEPREKKTLKDHLQRLTIPRNICLFTFVITSTLIMTNFQLISIILSCSLATPVFSLQFCIMILLAKKNTSKDLVDWCEGLYDIEKTFHKQIQDIAYKKLIEIEINTTKVFKLFTKMLYIDSFGFTMGFAIIGMFLPENIYPKYSPPVPFYLPFKNQDRWLAFITTTICETIIAIDTSTICIFINNYVFCYLTHILGYLEIIQETAERMKYNITKKSTVQTLSNTNTVESTQASLSFDEWIAILSDMICDVNSIITTLSELYALPMLCEEISCLGSLFICGLICTVIKQQYFFAFGITIVCLIFFIVCYINELILEKFKKINETLYDIPWYDLNPSQRRSLSVLMHCDKIQNGLTAAGIHKLTFERFGIVIKTGYTNLLILKDLVQKR